MVVRREIFYQIKVFIGTHKSCITQEIVALHFIYHNAMISKILLTLSFPLVSGKCCSCYLCWAKSAYRKQGARICLRILVTLLIDHAIIQIPFLEVFILSTSSVFEWAYCEQYFVYSFYYRISSVATYFYATFLKYG